MHTYIAENGTVFNYNSDFSGKTVIADSCERITQIEVPAEDLVEFIFECHTKPKLIEKIENATDNEL